MLISLVKIVHNEVAIFLAYNNRYSIVKDNWAAAAVQLQIFISANLYIIPLPGTKVQR
jgi:hypothetical protein